MPIILTEKNARCFEKRGVWNYIFVEKVQAIWFLGQWIVFRVCLLPWRHFLKQRFEEDKMQIFWIEDLLHYYVEDLKTGKIFKKIPLSLGFE